MLVSIEGASGSPELRLLGIGAGTSYDGESRYESASFSSAIRLVSAGAAEWLWRAELTIPACQPPTTFVMCLNAHRYSALGVRHDAEEVTREQQVNWTPERTAH